MDNLSSSFLQEDMTSGRGSFRSLNVDGLKEIQTILKALPTETANKIKTEVMLSCLNPILLDLKTQLPVRTGKLVKSLKARVSNKRAGIIYGQVTTTGKAGSVGNLIENGWWLTSHKIRLGVADISHRIKFIPGRRIFRQVLEANANRVVDEFTRGIDEETRKAQRLINGGA